MTVYLVRHGEPNWTQVSAPEWVGAANDFAALTVVGVEQAVEAAAALRGNDPTLVLSSPMTRALQTAAVMSRALETPLVVELDLREWLPDRSYQWTSSSDVATAYDEMIECGGEWPDGQTRRWEPLSAVRVRAWTVLDRYLPRGHSVVAVCHEVVIHALTGERHTPHGQIKPLGPG